MHSSFTKNLSLSLATLGALALPAAAQSISFSAGYAQNRGNGDAGVSVSASTGVSAKRTVETFTTWYGPYAVKSSRERTSGAANGKAQATLKFLGEQRSAGYFSISVGANHEVWRNNYGQVTSSSCFHNGSVYLSVAGTTLWNWSLAPTFGATVDYHIRIMTPYLVVPMPAGILALHGRGYGRVRGYMNATLNPCAPEVLVDGDIGVSGHGHASVVVLSVLFGASVDVSFFVDDQRIDVNALTARPGISLSSWGHAGHVFFRSGSMRGYIKLKAYLPPAIPISKTLADWSKDAQTTLLL